MKNKIEEELSSLFVNLTVLLCQPSTRLILITNSKVLSLQQVGRVYTSVRPICYESRLRK